MTKKKERQSKFVHGGNVVWFQGRDDHLSIHMDDGDRIAISGEMIFKMLDYFDLEIIQYGDYWKVTGFELKGEEVDYLVGDRLD